KAGDDAFQFFANGVKLEKLLHGKDRHGHAATGRGFQEALFLQTSERLANRGAADTKAGGHLFFPQRVTGTVDPIADRSQDRLIGALSSGFGKQVLLRAHGCRFLVVAHSGYRTPRRLSMVLYICILRYAKSTGKAIASLHD